MIHLLQETRSKYLLVSHDPSIQRLVGSAYASPALKSSVGEPISIPTFEYLFGGTESDFDPLPPMQRQERNRPSLILHSTGEWSSFIDAGSWSKWFYARNHVASKAD